MFQEEVAYLSEKLLIQDTPIGLPVFIQDKELAKTVQTLLPFNFLYSIERGNFMSLSC
jgi:hypothetical protein